MFVTLKVIGPAGRAENFDSLKASSLGLPAVTVTTVTFAARCVPTFPAAEPTTVSSRARIAREETPRTALSERLRCMETTPFERRNWADLHAQWSPHSTRR